MNVCSECKWFKGLENEVYNPYQMKSSPQPECLHPDAHSRDLIYGRAFCANERDDNKGCGKQGKLWEKKSNGNSAI